MGKIRDLKMEFVYIFQREPKHNKPVTEYEILVQVINL